MLTIRRDANGKNQLVLVLPKDLDELAKLAGAVIKINVMSAHMGQAILSVKAAMAVKVYRKELWEKILQGIEPDDGGES